MSPYYPKLYIHYRLFKSSLVVQTVKHLSTTQETQVRSLGWEDPLEQQMATHSSILAWKNLMDGAWYAAVHGVTKSRTRLSDFTSLPRLLKDRLLKPFLNYLCIYFWLC